MKKTYTLLVLWAMLTSLDAICLPKLSSLPTAQATIFLDFDGHHVTSSVWNGGTAFTAAPAQLSDAQITEIFNRVSEDYRPFNIDITTDSTVFLAAPLNRRIRIIVTPTSSWYGGVGGVSYTGSFTWGDDTPGFVFTDRLANYPKYIAECCTHESGHTVGLSHQSYYNSSCALVETYYSGTGSGEIGWAPVMGNSYYKNLTGWNNGPTPNGCTAAQDNLSIITSVNGFTYRTDDHSDNVTSNPTNVTISNQAFSTSGIITTQTDKDAFKFVLTTKGSLHLDAIPFNVNASTLDGANLDVKLVLYNSSYNAVKTYDPAANLAATIDTTLDAGTWYVTLQGTGNANTSNYGSLGSYTMSGTFTPTGVTPIRDVALTGRDEHGVHILNWNIIADEAIKSITIQRSSDGRFFTNLASVDPNLTGYSYAPAQDEDIFYRLKVTSVIDQTVYSNVIAIKAPAKVESLKVSTLVHTSIVINGNENYQYRLADMQGRVLKMGTGIPGSNEINISNLPNGLYAIQFIGKNIRQTERILKQ